MSPIDPLSPTVSTPTARSVFFAFLLLGLTSFGGPIAHLGYFRREFVARRGWLDDAAYAEIVALCQFLPGPTSSQVGFALGLRRAGASGALAAFLGFTLPSALLMIAFALGLGHLDSAAGAALLHGLKIAAVAVVADAVVGMARTQTPDMRRAAVALLAGVMVLALPGAFAQVLAIAAGAALCLTSGLKVTASAQGAIGFGPSRCVGWTALAFCALLLIGPSLLGASPLVTLFDAFFRSGALVFGGGHVVLPLLEAEVVATGAIDRQSFLAGYGLAQAMPGPLFTFAAFLGALMPGVSAPTGALVALLAIFLPGFLLLVAVLPIWSRLRTSPLARSALAGANAAVVGLLVAALFDLVRAGSLASPADIVLALAAFAALRFGGMRPILVVGATAAAALALSPVA